MDHREYRKRVVLGLLTQPASLFPMVGGASLLLGAWAMGQGAGPLPFAGVVGLLAGAGMFLSRLFAGGGIGRKVLQDLEQEENRQREAALDELEQRLAADGDPRTEAALRDLRRLASGFRGRGDLTAGLNAASGFDLLTGMDQLYQSSLATLRQTLSLWEMAYGLENRAARERVLAQREALVGEVQEGIVHLGNVLVRLQTLHTAGSSRHDLRRLREELDRNLEIAQRVEARINAWEREALPRDEGRPSSPP